MSREFRSIINYPSYQISNDGHVKNSRGKEKSLSKSDDGYLKVDLYSAGIRSTKRVHRLVAEAFIPNPYNKPEINHKDGNKHNNNAKNLEWVNRSENMRHASANRLLHPNPRRGDEHPRPMLGCKNPNAALKRRVKVRIIETDEVFNSIIDCALAINGSDRRISECLHDRQKSHMGYHFERV